MQPKLVVVASFNMPHQAHLAKTRLEAAGIPVFIRDEHLISINQLYSPALGGVKLEVPDVHLQEALNILNTESDFELLDEEALNAVPIEEPESLRAGRNLKSSEVRPGAAAGGRLSANSPSGQKPPEMMECSHCGSRGFIEENPSGVERVVNGLLLGLPWWWLGCPLLCRACGHRFRRQ